MKNLKTIEAKVKAILQKNEDARNDDMTLYLIVCNTNLKGAGAMPFAEVMEQYKYLGLPSFESVGRTRRKLQAKYPELAGNARVRQLRAEGEKAYRKYAKEVLKMALNQKAIKVLGKVFEAGFTDEKSIAAMTMDDILAIQGITIADIGIINELQKSIKANKVISFFGGNAE